MSPPTYPGSSRKPLSRMNKIAIALVVLLGPPLCLLALSIVNPFPQYTVIEVQNNYDYPVKIYTDYYSHTPEEAPHLMGIVPRGSGTTMLSVTLPYTSAAYHLMIVDSKGMVIGDVHKSTFDIMQLVPDPPGRRLYKGYKLWHVALPQDVVPRVPSSHETVNKLPE